MQKLFWRLKEDGVRLRTIAYGIVVFACLVLLLSGYGIYRIDIKYHNLIHATDTYIDAATSIQTLESYSNYLTTQSRQYVISSDPAYIDAYFDEINDTMITSYAMGKLKRNMFPDNEEICERIDSFMELSNAMTEAEIHALKLITVRNDLDIESLPKQLKAYELSEEELAYSKQEMLDQAYYLLFGRSYMALREDADANMQVIQNEINAITRADREEAAEQMLNSIGSLRVCLVILFFVILLVLCIFVLLVLRPIYVIEEDMRKQERLKGIGPKELRDLVKAYNLMHDANAASRVELAHEAEHDALTGLLNRGAFDKLKGYLEEAVEPTALILLDVDNFKGVNDTYGHQVGDEALKKVAELLKENFRSNDYPARTGGDEFAVIMTSITPKEKDIIRKKITSMNDILSKADGNMPKLSLSAGIAFSKIGYKPELYKMADEALYKTKEHGKCGYTFYGDWKN